MRRVPQTSQSAANVYWAPLVRELELARNPWDQKKVPAGHSFLDSWRLTSRDEQGTPQWVPRPRWEAPQMRILYLIIPQNQQPRTSERTRPVNQQRSSTPYQSPSENRRNRSNSRHLDLPNLNFEFDAPENQVILSDAEEEYSRLAEDFHLSHDFNEQDETLIQRTSQIGHSEDDEPGQNQSPSTSTGPPLEPDPDRIIQPENLVPVAGSNRTTSRPATPHPQSLVNEPVYFDQSGRTVQRQEKVTAGGRRTSAPTSY